MIWLTLFYTWFWYQSCLHILVVFCSCLDWIINSYVLCSANMPTTSWFMVSSISYHYCYGSSLSAIGCCITSWFPNVSSNVPHTGNHSFSCCFEAAYGFCLNGVLHVMIFLFQVLSLLINVVSDFFFFFPFFFLCVCVCVWVGVCVLIIFGFHVLWIKS